MFVGVVFGRLVLTADSTNEIYVPNMAAERLIQQVAEMQQSLGAADARLTAMEGQIQTFSSTVQQFMIRLDESEQAQTTASMAQR